jgi:hypothetical protein
VQLVALKMSDDGGFTLEQLQAELDKHGRHVALKLLLFMHTDRGWGWKKGEDGLIRAVRT